MKIAVTGATGYVGQHVVRALRAQGVSATLITRPGRERLPEQADLPHVACDMDQPTQATYEQIGRPDLLIHLAWGGLPNYRNDEHLQQELPRQMNWLDALIASGLQGLLVAGTCFEYGMQGGELSEDTPARPENPYGQAKNALREHLEKMKASQRFNLTWARLFYNYGEGQPKHSLYSLLCRAAQAGDAEFPMSGGEQVRDFLPINEVAQRIARLALMNQNVGVINICSGEPITVLALVERWIAENGWSIKPRTGVFPYPDYEPMAFWGSRHKLDRLLEASDGPA